MAEAMLKIMQGGQQQSSLSRESIAQIGAQSLAVYVLLPVSCHPGCLSLDDRLAQFQQAKVGQFGFGNGAVMLPAPGLVVGSYHRVEFPLREPDALGRSVAELLL